MNPLLIPDHPARIEWAEDPKLSEKPVSEYHFPGAGIETMGDHKRATHYEALIFGYLLDCQGAYRTIEQISSATGVPQISIGSHLRNMRMLGHGGHDTSGRRRPGTNQWEYHLIPNPNGMRPK